MKAISAALWSEFVKIRKSRIFLFSNLFFVFVALMMGLMTYLQIHPELSQKLGIIGTKASLLSFGEPGWKSFFGLISQTVAAIGLIGFGFVTSWVFGREYSDKTIKDILALPVPRSYIVLAKFVASALWCLVLAVVLFLSSLLSGKLAGLQGWSEQAFSSFAGVFIKISFLTILLCPPVAFFSGLGRGYLLPLAFIILTMLMANFSGLVGLGPWFPWSIPGMLCVQPDDNSTLSHISFLILLLTSIAGYVATLTWWRYADQR